MASIDLTYEPGSLLPKIQRKQVREFEKDLADFFEEPIRLPQDYVEHMLANHGGVPEKKCFVTPSKQVRVLCRFFNFLKEEDLKPPLIPSWRTESGYSASEDIRLDYSVYRYFDEEMWDSRLSESDAPLVPIAGLDTAGHNCRVMAEYDLLCFQYGDEDEPAVVAFDFHASVDEAVTEFIAPSFTAFLAMLHPCGAKAAVEAIDRF